MLLLALVVSQVTARPHDNPRLTAVSCVFAIGALALWRALARVGYRAPLVTVAGLLRSKRRRRWEEAAALHEGLEGGRRGGPGSRGASDDGDEEDGLRPSPRGHPLLGAATPATLGNGLRGPPPDAFTADDLEGGPDSGDGGGAASTSPSSRRGQAKSSPVRFLAQVRAAAARDVRAARNRTQRLLELSALEARLWQWCGVLGVAAQALSSLALAYDRLWLGYDPSTAEWPSRSVTAFTYLYAILAWAGQTLLASSVPYELPPVGHLDDPAVAPPRTAGPAMRVVIVIPAADSYDVAEVAVP